MNHKPLIRTVVFGFAVLTILLSSGIFSSAHAVTPPVGPKSAGLRISQYTGTAAEMVAVEAGDLDIQDWPAPFALAGPTGTWNTCGSTAPVAVNCEGTRAVTDAQCAADNAITPGICTPSKLNLYRVNDLGMFELDFNNFDYAKCSSTVGGVAWQTLYPGSCSSANGGPNNNGFNPIAIREFRHALAKLIDHPTQLANIAGNFGLLICDPAPTNLPWDLHSLIGSPQPTCSAAAGATGNCVAYTGITAANNGPLASEPFDPTCAKTLIHNIGFKTGCTAPAGAVNAGAAVYCSPGGLPFVIRVDFRSDDPLRTAFGQYLISQMTAGLAAITAIDGTTSLATIPVPVTPATALAFEAPWDDWEVYTAGWSLNPDPLYLHDLWHPSFASTGCGGGWTSTGPTNYLCYLGAGPQTDAISFAPTLAAGYAAGTTALNQFLSDLPMYPLYSLNAARPVAKHDETPGGGWALTAPLWKDIVNFRDQLAGTGFGPDSYDSFLNMQASLTDTLTRSTSYTGTIDYGFRFPIIKANIITSQFLWDYLLMGNAYETLLVRDPTSVFTWAPHVALNSPSFVTGPNDPTNLAGPDWSDYTTSTGALASYIRFRLPTWGTVKWTNGDNFNAEDVQFSIQYCKVPSTGCFSFTSVFDVSNILLQGPLNPDNSHSIITVELAHQSAWIRNNIGAGYFLINHKAWGCAPVTGMTGSFAVSYNPAQCFPTPDTQFVWQTAANHITLGPWVLASISSLGGTHLLQPNNPSVGVGTAVGSCPTTGCPGYYQEARLSLNDPDVTRDGKVNIADFFGLLNHLGNDRTIPTTWTYTLDSFNANSPRADVNNDGKVNIADFITFLSYNGLNYPCAYGTDIVKDPTTGALSCASI